MKQEDTRVLARIQARNLTEEEIQTVTGGLRTLTPCTISGGAVRDGDTFLGEC